PMPVALSRKGRMPLGEQRARQPSGASRPAQARSWQGFPSGRDAKVPAIIPWHRAVSEGCFAILSVQGFAGLIVRSKGAQRSTSPHLKRGCSRRDAKEDDEGSLASWAERPQELPAQPPGKASKSIACGSLRCQRRRARSRKRLP